MTCLEAKDTEGLLFLEKGSLPRSERQKRARSMANSYEFPTASCKTKVESKRVRTEDSHTAFI